MTPAVREAVIAFGGLDIAYDARVLTPRPWTLAQGEWAAELLVRLPDGPVLELCAGAGQIGLSAVVDNRRHLVCVDLDETATEYARRNAAAAGMADRVEVRRGREAEAVEPDERFALVIADPPWVRSAETTTYPEDPPLAIDGGADGLQIARSCVRVAEEHVMPRGAVLLQVGSIAQARRLEEELEGSRLGVSEVREYERGVVVLLEERHGWSSA